MHIEVLVEDASGARLIESLLPKIVGGHDAAPNWRIRSYRGVGRLPRGLRPGTDPSKRILLDQLPRLLGGYGRTPGIDAVIVVLDSDRRDCKAFLKELFESTARISPAPKTLFRLAIEEMEAWLLGDRKAVLAAYPRAKKSVLDGYAQGSVCGTWEVLADAVHPGGASALRKAGWPLPGQMKHEWAEKIGGQMEPSRNASPSFRKFAEGVARIAKLPSEA